MGYAAQRMAEAVQSALGNVGQALLSNLAQKRQQEQFDERQALAERGVDLQAQQLAQAKEQAAAQLAQTYTLHGFQQAPSTPAEPAGVGGDSQLFHPDVMRGQSLSMDGAPGASVGAALLSAVTPMPKAPMTTSPAPDGPAPAPWMYNPEVDPAAVLAAREAAARAEEGRQNRQTQIQVAKIGDSGATARNQASIAAQRERYGIEQDEPTAQAAAVNMIRQHGGDYRAAYAEAKGVPSSPAFRQQVLNAIAGLEAQSGSRSLLGIGASGDDAAALAALRRSLGH